MPREIVSALPGFRLPECGHFTGVRSMRNPGHGRETAGTALDTFVRAVAPQSAETVYRLADST